MNTVPDLETIAHYLKRIPNKDGEPIGNTWDVAAEIECACHGLADTINNLEVRIKALEKELAKAKSSASHAANVASCLANGIQPD